MSSEFGKYLKITVFGESHGDAVGITADGFPAGEYIDLEILQKFMSRRQGGKNALSTSRNESDIPEFLSGVTDGSTNGFPLCAIIRNQNVRSSDYSAISDKPRPSHADYTAFVKWNGKADMRGGGHFSGRLTAPLCAVGGIAIQILEHRGIFIGGHLSEIAGIKDTRFTLLPSKEMFDDIAAKQFPVIDDERGALMQAEILKAAEANDSVGGIIECAVTGLPVGLGSPMFDGLENRLAAAVFGIPAVKGIEFGSGFDGSRMRGSENNDPFTIDGSGDIHTVTNNCGGIAGGISNGMPVVFRAAVKPTPSIGIKQQTVNLSSKEITSLEINGRHDPCIAHRAVPVIEAVSALVILDLLLEKNHL